MIAYVQGIIEDVSEDNVVIDVNGIGYNVRILRIQHPDCPGPEKCFVFIHILW